MKSFAEIYPELISEWSDENVISPDKISYGSNRKIIWNGECGHTWDASAKNRGHGHGCPYCTGNKVLNGFNDLATLYPELCEEWSDINTLRPEDVTAHAPRSAWWECRKCKVIWKARIADRADGHGCPVCAGEKLLPGLNDFATLNPWLAMEWSARNEIKADEVWSKSRKSVWWKCGTCGHEWKAVINSRVKGQECPVCCGRKLMKGYNDLKTLYPEIAAEWDYIRNEGMLPEEMRAVSTESVFWKDSFGHMWKARISDRTEGAECPICKANRIAELKQRAVIHYAREAGEMIEIGNEDIIGISLQLFLPVYKVAIEFPDKHRYTYSQYNRENAKNWLCFNSGIKLYRIITPDDEEFNNCICITIPDDSDDIISQAIQAVFDRSGIETDVDIGRDKAKIMELNMDV